jgi:hypothetical protein
MFSAGRSSYINCRANFQTPSIKGVLHDNSLGVEGPNRQENV